MKTDYSMEAKRSKLEEELKKHDSVADAISKMKALSGELYQTQEDVAFMLDELATAIGKAQARGQLHSLRDIIGFLNNLSD